MGEITTLLALWRGGDREAFDRLAPLVYEHLRKVAGNFVRGERQMGLQPTELIHELFVDLLRLKRVEIEDRNHFFALSAKVMRQILIKFARERSTEKRGSAWERLPLDDSLNWAGKNQNSESGAAQVLDLSGAMDELEQYDETALRAVELRYFFGFTAEETAECLGISKATVDRHIRFALSWMHSKLHH